MTGTPLLNDRHVVPRWRSLVATIGSSELAMPSDATKVPSRNPSAELVKRLEAWRLRPDTVTASEAVEAAIVEGLAVEAVLPARVLLLPGSGATTLVRQQADLLLRELGETSDLLGNSENPGGASPSIARWRLATHISPRDPLAWVELALSYVTVGKDKPALRAMAVALQLAPYDRHVLRSASRLFLHRRDAEQAHDLLRNNPATRTDPWLMAGEIALAALAERTPRFFKAGATMVADSGMRPRHLSELASAIGTVHLKDGNRRARKLFNTSLVDPTGNSLAQAEWANPHLAGLVDPQILDRSKDSIEARVLQAYWQGDFHEVVSRCDAWGAEEPYSSRPTLFGSGAAITIEDYPAALRFCDEGLKKNPNQVILRNNRAYSLVATGRYPEAFRQLASNLASSEDNAVATAMATYGFLQMRTGNCEHGAKLYRDAIAYFKRSNNVPLESLALAYFALEEARAERPEASQILADARIACKRLPHLKEAPILIDRAERWLKAVAHRKAPTSLVGAF
jgi:tetratricopeptide (TPR) repeat protein